VRLSTLDPRWVAIGTGEARIITGVSFDCPHCKLARACPTCGHAPDTKRLSVQFWPPIDKNNWLPRVTPIPHDGWHQRVSGESFEDLTISPSIGFDSIGHWHGHIQNGEAS